MKKKVIFFSILILSFMITGCGNKTIKCSSISKQAKYSVKTNYEIVYKSDIVKKVKIKQVINSKEKDILKDFKTQQEEQYGTNQSLYGGYSYEVSIKKNKVISNVVIDYKKINMKKFITNNGAMKDYVNKKNQFTKEGALKLYKSTGAKCE